MKKLIIGSGVTLAALAGGLFVAAPAVAATSDCPSGAACIWKDTSYETAGVGSHDLGFQNYIQNYSGYDYSGTSYNANDSATSVYNNGGVDQARFYTDAGYSGAYFTLPRQVGDGNLANSAGYVGPGYNDRISSGKFVG